MTTTSTSIELGIYAKRAIVYSTFFILDGFCTQIDMYVSSPYPPFTFTATNVLDYAFPVDKPLSDEPLWIDSQHPEKALSPKQALGWIKRTCFGLEKLGLRRGDVVMIYTVNHIFVPPAYYGIVGGGFIFSAANPAYTVNGKCTTSHGEEQS